MKLRLQENSIRLRLSSNEILKLRDDGKISEKIQFNQNQFLIYTITILSNAKVITIDFTDAEILVAIPFDTARNWTETELIGLEHEQTTGENLPLKITIEKDFAG